MKLVRMRNTCVLYLIGLITPILPALAQSTLGSLSEESVLTLANINSGLASGIDSNTVSALQAGALELRQSVQYDATRGMMQITGFTVAPGSPLPTPAASLGLNAVWSYAVQVSQVRLPAKPKNKIALIGTLTAASINPFGDVTGTPAYFSAAYSAATGGSAVMNFATITADIAGCVTFYSASGSGNAQINVPAAASVAPIAVAGPKGTQITTGNFQLDGTNSSDPTGGVLAYQWTYLQSQGQPASITGSNTATPSVVIPQNAFAFGDYTFLLTVTNSAGLTSSDIVTVTYADPNNQG